jgi:inorganic pyrophosphatase
VNVNPTNLENIPTFSSAKDDGKPLVHAVIETPRDTRHKYAFEPALGTFKLKQLLPEGLEWPYDYGFIPQTLADDGDPLDILVLSDVPTFTGCLVECRLIGLVRLKQDGVENDRVIAAPMRRTGVSQTTDKFDDIDDIPKETIQGICRFLVEYSAEQGHDIELKDVKSKKKAESALETAIECFEKRHRKK